MTFKRPERFSEGGQLGRGPSAWADDVEDAAPAAKSVAPTREFKRPGGFVDPGAGEPSARAAAPPGGSFVGKMTSDSGSGTPPRQFKRAGGYEESGAEDPQKSAGASLAAAGKLPLKAAPPQQRMFLRGDGAGDDGDLDEDMPKPVMGPVPAELPATRAAQRQVGLAPLDMSCPR